ncbi:MAG: hybrid sensor histidine kinase/response regulator [Bacteroidetes bacterium]|nr:hybrid sensor histidine kinase/response regulator [Bacteroidota bacterium]
MTNKLKILILEDNYADADLTIRALKKSDLLFEHRLVENKVDFVVALQEFHPDVILSDHSLPSFTSSEALPIAREICGSSVFILVTGTVSEEFAVDILKAGADDYVLKSSLTRLPSAITNAFLKKRAEYERENNWKKLLEANHELKTFIYRASHDIRGPLSSMKGLINVAKLEKGDDLNSLIKMMDVSAEKLDKILIDLIETVGVRDRLVDRKEIDFKELINEILTEYQNYPRFDALRISIDIDDSVPFYSDQIILSMLLKRIVDNAIKFHNYSSNGSYVNIRIAANEGGVNIFVVDNGSGIKEELTDRVFEMFYRANSESDGSGLGLYLVKIGVEKLRGTISLKSSEQMGTTVHVFLPS